MSETNSNNESSSDQQLPLPTEEAMTPYVSLHNITHYSLMNSKIKPIELLKRAKELGMPAVAITDFNSFAGIYEAYKFAKFKDFSLYSI